MLDSVEVAEVPSWVFSDVVFVPVLHVDLGVSLLLLLIELLLEHHSHINPDLLANLAPGVRPSNLLLLFLTQPDFELL